MKLPILCSGRLRGQTRVSAAGIRPSRPRRHLPSPRTYTAHCDVECEDNSTHRINLAPFPVPVIGCLVELVNCGQLCEDKGGIRSIDCMQTGP